MEIITLIILFIATYLDIKDFKIPNWVTYPLITGGIIWTCYIHEEWYWLVLKLALVMAFMVSPIFGGGGDRKLLMGVTLANTFLVGVFCFVMGVIITGIYILIRNRIYTYAWLPHGLKGERETLTSLAPGILISYLILLL